MLGRQMLMRKEMPKMPESVKQLMYRIVSCPYFNTEQPGGFVPECLDNYLQKGRPGNKRRVLEDLRKELAAIYTPSESRGVFGYLSWKAVEAGALTSRTRWWDGAAENVKAIADGRMDVEKKIANLRSLWRPCLAAMHSYPFVKRLLSARPPKSTVPHSHALLDCIEHTWLLMLGSGISVYSTLDTKYSELMDGRFNEGRMHCRFEQEVLPRHVEKNLRRMAIEAHLKGELEPEVGRSRDPFVLATMKAAKRRYMRHGFRKRDFPPESSPWVARDPQDLSEQEKMMFWLWDRNLRYVFLHPDLLLAGGVAKDDEVRREGWDDNVDDLFEEDSPHNFDNRDRFVAESVRVKPGDNAGEIPGIYDKSKYPPKML